MKIHPLILTWEIATKEQIIYLCNLNLGVLEAYSSLRQLIFDCSVFGLHQTNTFLFSCFKYYFHGCIYLGKIIYG